MVFFYYRGEMVTFPSWVITKISDVITRETTVRQEVIITYQILSFLLIISKAHTQQTH